jgi:hypothetical protein
MKKLVFLFLSLLTAGSLFQACDNSKTYAEMLEDEKNAVNKFIKIMIFVSFHWKSSNETLLRLQKKLGMDMTNMLLFPMAYICRS